MKEIENTEVLETLMVPNSISDSLVAISLFNFFFCSYSKRNCRMNLNTSKNVLFRKKMFELKYEPCQLGRSDIHSPDSTPTTQRHFRTSNLSDSYVRLFINYLEVDYIGVYHNFIFYESIWIATKSAI